MDNRYWYWLLSMKGYMRKVIDNEGHDLLEADIEDIISEVMCRGIKYQHSFEAMEESIEKAMMEMVNGQAEFKAPQNKAGAGWVATITKNCLIDKQNSDRLQYEETDMSKMEIQGNTPEEDVWSEQIIQGDYLSGLHREIFICHHQNGESLKEMAVRKNLSHDYLKKMSSQTKNLVKEQMGV